MADVQIRGLGDLNTVRDIRFDVDAGGKFVIYRFFEPAAGR